MLTLPDTLPDDPTVLKHLLAEVVLSAQKLTAAQAGQISQLQEQVALLRQRLFGRKSEQTVDPQSPQLAMFNEAEELIDVPATKPIEADADIDAKEVVAPAKRRGKRKPLPANLPRVEVVHDLPGHELTLCLPQTGDR